MRVVFLILSVWMLLYGMSSFTKKIERTVTYSKTVK